MCLEKLLHLINEEVRLGTRKPLAVTRTGLLLSHVCFVDDIILFGDATEAQLHVMLSILDRFCKASGEKVSLLKFKMHVSSNLDHDRAMRLSNCCRIPLTKDFSKYLGVPMIYGRVTKHNLNDLLSKMQAKLCSWENKHLSLAGRVTLAQLVLCALPTYVMQTVFLADNVVTEIDRMITSLFGRKGWN